MLVGDALMKGRMLLGRRGGKQGIVMEMRNGMVWVGGWVCRYGASWLGFVWVWMWVGGWVGWATVGGKRVVRICRKGQVCVRVCVRVSTGSALRHTL